MFWFTNMNNVKETIVEMVFAIIWWSIAGFGVL